MAASTIGRVLPRATACHSRRLSVDDISISHQSPSHLEFFLSARAQTFVDDGFIYRLGSTGERDRNPYTCRQKTRPYPSRSTLLAASCFLGEAEISRMILDSAGDMSKLLFFGFQLDFPGRPHKTQSRKIRFTLQDIDP